MQMLELIKSPEIVAAFEGFGTVACHGRLAYHGRPAYASLNPGGAAFLGVTVSVPELWARDPSGEFVPSALDFQIGIRSGMFTNIVDGEWSVTKCVPINGIAGGQRLNLSSYVFACPQAQWVTVRLDRITGPDSQRQRRRLALHSVTRLRPIRPGVVTDLLIDAQIAAEREVQNV